MNRRNFLRAGIVAGAGAVSVPVLAKASNTTITPEGPESIAQTLNNDFIATPITVTPVNKAGQQRVYVTLLATARDNERRTKVGASWYYDLQEQAWTQKKGWASPGTEAKYTRLLNKVQQRLSELV